MTENELRNYLKSAYYLDKKIKSLESLVNQCRINAQRLSANSEYKDTVRNPSAKNSTETAIFQSQRKAKPKNV